MKKNCKSSQYFCLSQAHYFYREWVFAADFFTASWAWSMSECTDLEIWQTWVPPLCKGLTLPEQAAKMLALHVSAYQLGIKSVSSWEFETCKSEHAEQWRWQYGMLINTHLRGREPGRWRGWVNGNTVSINTLQNNSAIKPAMQVMSAISLRAFHCSVTFILSNNKLPCFQ